MEQVMPPLCRFSFPFFILHLPCQS